MLCQREKVKKGLVAESFDWDEESISSEDEGVTRFKAFMAIAEDEPTVGKTDARSGQWVEITMKKGNEKKQSPQRMCCSLRVRTLSKTSLDVTSDTEFVDDNQEPLHPLPKLSGAEPIGTSNDV
ncbi:hypothetical protein Tco_0830025 [Tanacetum coccineum]